MPEGQRPRGLYTMAATRALTGLTDRQLRYYDQLGLVVPARSRGRHRLYSAGDIRRLLAVRRMRQGGMAMRDIAAAIDLTARAHGAGRTPSPPSGAS